MDSVCQQTYRHLQIIVLDDASTDNSMEIINKFQSEDKRIMVHSSANNSGSTFHQWARGINLAKGELVWIAESDDVAATSFVKNAVDRMKDLDVLYIGESEKIDHKGISLGRVHANDQEIWTSDFEMPGSDMITNHFAFNNYVINASSAIFRRSAALNVSDRYKNYTFCGDWQFWIEIMRQGNLMHTSDIVNYYRIHKTNVTGKALKEGLYLTEGLKVLNYISQLGVPYNRTRASEKWYQYFHSQNYIGRKRLSVSSIRFWITLLIHFPSFVGYFIRRQWTG